MNYHNGEVKSWKNQVKIKVRHLEINYDIKYEIGLTVQSCKDKES